MQTEEVIARKAVEAMKSALSLLDSADLPADVGAHLDLAIERLKAHMRQKGWDPCSDELLKAS